MSLDDQGSCSAQGGRAIVKPMNGTGIYGRASRDIQFAGRKETRVKIAPHRRNPAAVSAGARLATLQGSPSLPKKPGRRFLTTTRRFTNSSPKAIASWFI